MKKDYKPKTKPEPTIELDQLFITKNGEKIHGIAITRNGKTVLDSDGNRYNKDELNVVMAIK